MSEIPTKPYLLRALYEWCADNGYTPYLAVKVFGQVRVPMEFVRNGEIVLDISMEATSGLLMNNEAISFKARFGGISRDIYIPIGAVAALYASENHQGMAFEVTAESPPEVAEKKKAPEAPVNEKPTMSLAVTNTEHRTEESTENSSAPDEKKSKEKRKKPNFTVIK